VIREDDSLKTRPKFAKHTAPSSPLALLSLFSPIPSLPPVSACIPVPLLPLCAYVVHLVRDEIGQRAYAFTEDPEHFLPLAGFLPVSASFLLSDLL
jgi:hypothetical protein